MNCVQKTKKTILEQNLAAPDDRIVAAVSGGPDSVALLYILHDIAADVPFTLSAAFFDHRIRPAVARERKLVERHCRSLRIPLVTGACDVPAEARRRKMGLEETARFVRYRFLEETAERWRADAVALGHTRDDQVETILHRIIRGTGWRGVTGIPPRRGIFIRPVLACTRNELRAYLRDRRISYAIDQSNRDNRLLRNRIRNRLLPYLRKHFNPSIDESLIRMGENLDEGWEALERTVARHIPRGSRGGPAGLPLETIQALGDFEIYLLIDTILRDRFGVVQDMEKSHFDAAKNLIRGGRSGARVHFPHGIVLMREQRELRLAREGEHHRPAGEIVVPGTGTYALPPWNLSVRIEPVVPPVTAVTSNAREAYVAGIRFPLRIRPRRNGDRMRPFGMRGTKKLSDLFIDRKVPTHRRDAIPVFEDGGGIFWVPGVSTDERTRIAAGTRTALHIVLTEE
ncbi:MAG TPA: tRNA lysidine(34) synthetase TilS [Patescibacteria group bacterium]|nr:tRNA lysidine(34) synthetase TilS [Patescibacteria group bacterium]